MAAPPAKLAKPKFDDPQLEALFRRGLEHETPATSRRSQPSGASRRRPERRARTTASPSSERSTRCATGADVIVQAALVGTALARPAGRAGQGRPARARLGAWSYEVEDTKLARETRAGAILQLGLYCELLEVAQGNAARALPHRHAARNARVPRRRLRGVLPLGARGARDDAAARDAEVAHRGDLPGAVRPLRHLPVVGPLQRTPARGRSPVAGRGHLARAAARARGARCRDARARSPSSRFPLPFEAASAARAETYERVREQARLQLESRDEPVALRAPRRRRGRRGSRCLPEPTPGDVFLDLEGAPFAGEHRRRAGASTCSASSTLRRRRRVRPIGAFWADSPRPRRPAFESGHRPDRAGARCAPGHARLPLRALRAVRVQAPDGPLRDARERARRAAARGRVRRSLRGRAPEPARGRRALLDQEPRAALRLRARRRPEGRAPAPPGRGARARARRASRISIPAVRAAVEGYNRDDCVSALRLRDWLESCSEPSSSREGAEHPAAGAESGDPSEASSTSGSSASRRCARACSR